MATLNCSKDRMMAEEKDSINPDKEIKRLQRLIKSTKPRKTKKFVKVCGLIMIFALIVVAFLAIVVRPAYRPQLPFLFFVTFLLLTVLFATIRFLLGRMNQHYRIRLFEMRHKIGNLRNKP